MEEVSGLPSNFGHEDSSEPSTIRLASALRVLSCEVHKTTFIIQLVRSIDCEEPFRMDGTSVVEGGKQ